MRVIRSGRRRHQRERRAARLRLRTPSSSASTCAPSARPPTLAEHDKVDIRLYTIIYDAVDEMKKAMDGLLEPALRKSRLGAAEVRETFRISKVGTVAGCLVTDGKITRDGQVRLLRDNIVIHTGKVVSLKRFKDDVQRSQGGRWSAASGSRTTTTSSPAT